MRNAILVVCWCAAAAQSFEVASVKPAAIMPGSRSHAASSGGPGTQDPGQIVLTNVPLMDAITRAYHLPNYQVTGPDWLLAERYDIAAKIPGGATKEEFSLMLQNLLTERFHLVVHREMKPMASYELVIGKHGSRLKATERAYADGVPQSGAPGMKMTRNAGLNGAAWHLTAKAETLSQLVDFLRGSMRAPVVDETGLTGKYDFTLEYKTERDLKENDAGSGLESALEQQLGLKLEHRKAPLEMLIIDHADRIPTQN